MSRTKQLKNYIQLMYCVYMTYMYIAQSKFKNICPIGMLFQFVCFIYFVEIFMLIVINSSVFNRKSRYREKNYLKQGTNAH